MPNAGKISSLIGDRKKRNRLLTMAVTFLAFLCALDFFLSVPPLPLLSADTRSYILGEWYRAPGYPLYLQTIYTLFGNMYYAVLLQLFVGVITLYFFLISMGRLYGAPLLASALVLYSIPHAHHLTNHWYLLTESPFITMLLAHFTLTALFLGNDRFKSIPICIGISLCAALATTLRVPGIVTLANLLFLMIYSLNKQHRLALAVPFLCVLATWSTYNLYRLGTFSPFVRGGWHQLANVAHLVEADMPGKHQELYAFIGTRNGSYKAQIDAASSFEERERMKYQSSRVMQYSRGEMEGWKEFRDAYVEKHRRQVCPGKRLGTGGFHKKVCQDALSKEIAGDTIRHNPGGFALLVGTNFLKYWSDVHRVQRFKGETIIKRYAEGASDQWTRKFGLEYNVGDKYDSIKTEKKPWLNLGYTLSRVDFGSIPLPWILSTLEVFAGFCIGCIFLSRTRLRPGAIRQLSPAFSMLFLLAMTTNAYFLSSSMAHNGIKRYSTNLEVLALTTLVFSLLLAYRSLRWKAERGQLNNRE